MTAQVMRTMSVEAALKVTLSESIRAAFPTVPHSDVLLTVSKFADYQCNNAMPLSRALAQLPTPTKLNPKQVGEQIVQHLRMGPTDIVESATVTDTGFINLLLGTQWLAAQVDELSHPHGPLRRAAPPTPSQRVLVDFSSPNIAKEMHVGHLRSTIIGESVCRLLEYLGHTVTRINHVGDWGTQFGMLILYLREQHPNFSEVPPPIHDLQAFYRAAKERFDADKAFADAARLEVVALQALQPDSIAAWRNICDVSRREFQQIYDRLGVKLEERGESFYNPLIPEVLRLLEEAGELRQSDGATVIVSTTPKKHNAIDASELAKVIAAFFVGAPKNGAPVLDDALMEGLRTVGAVKEGIVTLGKRTVPLDKIDPAKDLAAISKLLMPLFTSTPIDASIAGRLRAVGALHDDGIVDVPYFAFPLIVRKSDGGYTYDTTDVTAMYHRYVLDKQDRVIYVTDVGQFEHFRMCAQVAVDMKWMPHDKAWTHAGFGLVSGADGKKFKTRSGDTVRLKDLLDEAGDRCLETMQEREKGDRAQGYSEAEMVELSRRIGYAAVRYHDLKQNRTSDYTFSYDKMLDLNGNTAVFLLYAFARICGILRKAAEQGSREGSAKEASHKVSLTSPKERALALCLVRYDDLLLKVADDLYLHKLADYVYDIASKLGEFYTDCRVLGSEQQESRVMLLRAVANTLFAVMSILGIEPMERI